MKIQDLGYLPYCFLLLSLLTGCSSAIPELIREPVDPKITVEQARRSTAALSGKEIRWGGEIIEVENRRRETLIEILSYPLSDSGRPNTKRSAESRFISRIPGFVDPAEYKKGRSLTVFGKLRERVTRSLGDYPYTYPVVDTSAFHLWPETEPERPRVYYPMHPWPLFPYDYYRWYWPHQPVHP